MLKWFARWLQAPASLEPDTPPSTKSAVVPSAAASTTATVRAAPVAAKPTLTTSASSAREKSSMTKYKLEYIWLDGYTPVPSLRGKTQIKEFAAFPTLAELPLWGFDGSSTMQAEGHSSDCVLKPVAVFPDSARKNGVLVM